MKELLKVPAAILGKSPEKTTMPQGYDWLSIHPAFPSDSLEFIKRHIFFSFQWRASRDRHKPSYGWLYWPNDSRESGIALRILDIGDDDQGRPHCVRLEALWIKMIPHKEKISFLNKIISGAAWPDASLIMQTEPEALLDFNKDIYQHERFEPLKKNDYNNKIIFVYDKEKTIYKPQNNEEIILYDRATQSIQNYDDISQMAKAPPPGANYNKEWIENDFNYYKKWPRFPILSLASNLFLIIIIAVALFYIKKNNDEIVDLKEKNEKHLTVINTHNNMRENMKNYEKIHNVLESKKINHDWQVDVKQLVTSDLVGDRIKNLLKDILLIIELISDINKDSQYNDTIQNVNSESTYDSKEHSHQHDAVDNVHNDTIIKEKNDADDTEEINEPEVVSNSNIDSQNFNDNDASTHDTKEYSNHHDAVDNVQNDSITNEKYGVDDEDEINETEVESNSTIDSQNFNDNDASTHDSKGYSNQYNNLQDYIDTDQDENDHTDIISSIS